MFCAVFIVDNGGICRGQFTPFRPFTCPAPFHVIYFTAMYRLLKLITLLLLIGLLSFSVWYRSNGEILLSSLKTQIETEFSRVTDRTVAIDEIRLAFPGSLVLKNITIFSPDPETPQVVMGSLKVTPELLPLVTRAHIVSKIEISGFSSGNTAGNIAFRTASRRCQRWRDAFDAALLDKITITGGDLVLNGYSINKIKGTVELDETALVTGDLAFSWRAIPLSASFSRVPGTVGGYAGTLVSRDFTVDATLSAGMDTLKINKFRGIIFSLGMDLEGLILCLNSDDKIYEFTGTIAGNIKDLASLLFLDKSLRDTIPVTGSFSSSLDISVRERDPSGLILDAGIRSKSIMFDNIEVRDASGKISVADGKVRIYDTTFDLMKSASQLSASLDMSDPALPVALDIKTGGLDLDAVMNDSRDEEKDDYGALSLKASFRGSGRDLAILYDTVTSTGELPREGGLLSSLNMKLSASLCRMDLPRAGFSDISSDISFENSVLSVSSLNFDAFGGSFSGAAHADLSKKDFPSSLEMAIRGMDSDKVFNSILKMNYETRGPLEAGIALDLKGRDLPDILKDPRAYFMKLVDEKRICELGLTSHASLQKAVFGKNVIEDLSVRLSLRDGLLLISSLDLKTYGGDLSAKSSLDLTDHTMPFSVDTKIKDMNADDIFKNVMNLKDLARGRIKANMSLSGTSLGLSKVFKDLPAENAPAEAFARLRQNGTLKGMKFRSSIDIESVRLPKTDMEKFYAVASADSGVLDISSLGFSSFGGHFEGQGKLDLVDQKTPLDIKVKLINMDSSRIAGELFNSQDMLDGPINLILSFNGHGSYVSSVVHRLKQHDWKAKVPFQGTIRSLLVMLSEGLDTGAQKLEGELSLKTVKAQKARIDDLVSKFAIRDKHISIPFLRALFYDGSLSGYVDLDLSDDSFPFRLGGRISGSNLRAILRSFADPESPSYGRLDLKIDMKGKLDNLSSYTGYGEIGIYDGNLGPMPILAPLLGGLYETMQKIFPAFRKINITSAWATFDIDDRKIVTDDLVLAGNDICIVSEGFMGFDGKLDFSFVNELIEPETETEENWPDSIRNFVTSFGKAVSRAKLKGTVKKQKWEFEYLAPITRNIGNHLKAFFQGISQ
jgi:uncharacterized protein involved in outer membrane biogenesis